MPPGPHEASIRSITSGPKRSTPMTKFRMMLVAFAVAALASAAAASALPSTSVPFTAKYAGQASTKVDGNTANISATGTGTGTLSQQPCVPFGGLGKLTGVASTTVTFKVITSSQGCGDEGGHLFSL